MSTKPYENYLFSQLERAAARLSLKEDKQDTVTMDIPLLIRIMELVREDIKSDPDLHRVVERMLKLKDSGVLTMDHYDFIAGTSIKNSPAQDHNSEVSDIKKLAGI
jgi:hypothetical protein